MDIQFFDNGDQVPQSQDKIRIESAKITPYPDRYRLFAEIKVTPFQVRPNLLLIVRNSDQQVVCELNIIETMHANMEFTLHLRNKDDPAGDYELQVELFFESRNPPQDTQIVEFTIPSETDER